MSEHLLSHFDHHPETVQSLQDKQKKLMVIQIADSDVSVNGVDILKQALSNYKQDITPAIEIKRIIMGQMRDKAVPLTNGHFADTYKYDPTTKLPFRIIKEVGIRSMKEILDNLEAIFDHLFLESMIKKVPPQHR
ncbi:MAG: hypothetical protein LBG52_06535 [Candidatus Peribacteria bacterium]|nr:hypothetical protein [Candidatus Peribacteria bacterium]